MKRFYTLAEAATVLATGKARTSQHLRRLMKRHRGARKPDELWRSIEKAANEILSAAQGGEIVLTGLQDGDGERKQIPEISLVTSYAEPATDSIMPDYLDDDQNIEGIAIWRDVYISRRDIDRWMGRDTPVLAHPIRKATDAEIHEAITAVYDDADRAGRKPPNVKELISPLKQKMAERHLTATRKRMDDAASAKQHQKRRLPVGTKT
jgi:hypothetical protein